MSRIPQLVAWSAFVYAIIVLFVVLVYLPPFVAWSVWLYRLLLAAYPAPFRKEYGEAMAQVFRDTAREEYRRRGLRGLLVVWLRTLADFTVSVVRQHRDKPVQLSSESVLLRDLWQQWRQFGVVTFSATTFSAWYGWHLLRLFFQRAVLVWATLTVIAFGIWLGSFFDSMCLLRMRASRIDIGGGMVRILHADFVGDPITEEQWQRDVQAQEEKVSDSRRCSPIKTQTVGNSLHPRYSGRGSCPIEGRSQDARDLAALQGMVAALSIFPGASASVVGNHSRLSPKTRGFQSGDPIGVTVGFS